MNTKHITANSNYVLCLHHITMWSLWENDTMVQISVSSNTEKIGHRLVCAGVLLYFNEPDSQNSISHNYCAGLKRPIDF